MAEKLDVCFVVVIIIISSIAIKKVQYYGTDVYGLCLNHGEVNLERSLNILALKYCGKNCSRKSLLCLLLLLCGDIERCPGPTSPMSELLNTRGMKLFHQNVRGLQKNFSYLEKFVHDNAKIDVLTLSETHITPENDIDALFTIPGYTFVKRNRKTGRGGGVCCYISDKIQFKRRSDLEHERTENLCIEIILSNAKNFLLCTLYRPLNTSLYLPNDFNEITHNMLLNATTEFKEVILMGDINTDYLVKDDNIAVKNMFEICGFEQLVTKATRVCQQSSTLIDVTLTTNKAAIHKVDVIPTSLSDHDMVGCVRKINTTKFAPRTIRCRDFSKYDKNAVCQELASKNWNILYKKSDVQSAYNCFYSTLKSTIDAHAPFMQKRVKGKFSPWLSIDVKAAMNARDKLLRKARKTKPDDDWALYKESRNACNIAIRRAKKQYHCNLLEENSRDPKAFWKIIKTLLPFKSKTSTVTVDCENRQKANKFCRYFTSVARTLKEKAFNLKDVIWSSPKRAFLRTTKTFKFAPVTIAFVEKELRRIKRNKSTGLDDLPPAFLKDTARVIAAPLHHIINLSIKTSVVPTTWKSAKITPIFKSGTTDEARNYRPISVHTQLLEYLENNTLLSDKQFGYRRNVRQRLQQLFSLITFEKRLKRGIL